MSTFVTRYCSKNMLDTLITSKTRIRILVKFFINAANNGYLRGLAEEMNESTNSIRKELNSLSEAGYLEKKPIRIGSLTKPISITLYFLFYKKSFTNTSV